MRKITFWPIAILLLAFASNISSAESALTVLGKDYVFPNKVDGLPSKLSDFKDLEINSFVTSDGVKLTYWEAGSGKPLIFIPGLTGNGAEYINLMYLLRSHYHVYVLDPRNQGLSQQVDFGNRIARYTTDLKEFVAHLSLQSADFCGHSMGSSILWSFIDMYGTKMIHKAVFVDEPISISGRSEWTEKEKRDYGVMASSPDELVKMLAQPKPLAGGSADKSNGPKIPLPGQSTPAFVNSSGFANEVVKNDPVYMYKVLYDHAANDWHDVIQHKINVPVAIFTGDLSSNLASQQWEHSVITGSTLYVYSKEDGGDHLLMYRNPIKFAKDIREFLEK